VPSDGLLYYSLQEDICAKIERVDCQFLGLNIEMANDNTITVYLLECVEEPFTDYDIKFFYV
jgi:hypothetical protein